MCFSATASFTASTVLAFLGILAIKKARHRKTMLFFAATPFIFAIQQFCEGIIWISAPHAPGGLIHMTATYLFLFFAFLFWPVWIPVAAGLMEKNGWRKNMCHASLIAGILFDLFTGTQILYYGAGSAIFDCHIAYPTYGSADTFGLTTVLYLWAVLVPLMVSSVHYAWILGVAIAGSLLITTIWYAAHVVSVWCFFAALISGLTLFIIDADIKKTAIPRSTQK